MIGLNEIRKGSMAGNNNYIMVGILIIFMGILIFGVKRHFH